MTEKIATLIIGSERKKFQLGEPVILNCEIKNVSNKTINVIDKFEAEYDIIQYHTSISNKNTRFVPYIIIDFIPDFKSLDPQDSVYGMSKIFYGSKHWTFDKPGKYKIWATYNDMINDPNLTIKSNVLEIEVKKPESTAEKEQSKLIMGDEQGKFLLFDGGDHLEKGLESLNNLKDKFPNSILSSYVHFSLGMSFAQEFKNFIQDKVRPAKPGEAKEYLSKVTLKTPKEIRYKAYVTMITLSKSSERKKILEEMRKIFSGDRRFTERMKDQLKNK